MILINANGLSKTYVADPIFEDLSFAISEGDKIGLIGLNGSGKTTLFNILSGRLSPDGGEVHIQKDLNIGYLEQQIQIETGNSVFEECLSVFRSLIEMEKTLRMMEEEIASEGEKGESERLNELMQEYADLSEQFSSKNGYGYCSEIKGALKGLGFTEEDFEKPVSILSGGQKSRVMLAKLLLERPQFLLLDEPTNHLDIQAIEWLEKYLKEFNGTMLIISHDRYFLDRIVNRIFLLERKKLFVYQGSYTEFMTKRKKELEIQSKHYENQQEEIKRQQEIIKRFIKYGGERYNRLARSRQKLLDKMELIDKPMENKKSRFQFEPKITSGRDVFHIEELSKHFPDAPLFDHVNFAVYRGEKIGLIGPNGVGKTTLFNILLGKSQYSSGEIIKGVHVNVAYYEQEMKSLNKDKTILDEIWDDHPKLDQSTLRGYLGRFMFYNDDIFKEIGELSGGERARVSLLKLMLSNANVLMMDEPTNHLDIDSKEVLEDALRDYTGTLFVISHDRYFLNAVTNKILELSPNGITEYLGNYEYYLEKKEALSHEEEEETEEKTKTQRTLEKKRERERQSEEKKERVALQNLEREISDIENRLREIDESLCQPDIYENLEQITSLSAERTKLASLLEAKYEEWFEKKES